MRHTGRSGGQSAGRHAALHASRNGETLIDTLSNVLAQILVDTQAERVLQVEVVTLAKKPGDMENEAVVDMLEHASRVAARDV